MLEIIYNFYWTPLYTYCDKVLPQEVIDILSCNSYYYTRYDAEQRRKVKYPIKKSVYWNFYDVEEKSFPSGFLSEVICYLGEENCKVEFSKEKPQKILFLDAPFNNYLNKEGYNVREFQKECAQLAEVYGSGILEVGTGGGKTLIYGEIIRRLGVKTFFLTTDTVSRDQSYREFCKFFGEENVGRIDEREFDKSILVANIANCWAKFEDEDFLNYVDTAQLFIVNECHHINESKIDRVSALANTWFRIAMRVKAYYRIGATGTVGNEGSFKRFLLTAAIGPVIYTKSTRELIDEGFASNIEAHIYKIEIFNDEHSQYIKAYENMVTNLEFNDMIVKLAVMYSKQGKKVIIFCDWKVKQAQTLNNMLLDKGVICCYISGDEKKERWDLVKLFEVTQNAVMVTTVFSEDFNLPALDVGIIIGKKSNEVSLKQRIGRVARLFSGKEKGIVVVPYVQDWKAKGDKFVDGILAKHSKECIKIIEKEGHSIMYKKLN